MRLCGERCIRSPDLRKRTSIDLPRGQRAVDGLTGNVGERGANDTPGFFQTRGMRNSCRGSDNPQAAPRCNWSVELLALFSRRKTLATELPMNARSARGEPGQEGPAQPAEPRAGEPCTWDLVTFKVFRAGVFPRRESRLTGCSQAYTGANITAPTSAMCVKLRANRYVWSPTVIRFKPACVSSSISSATPAAMVP